MKQFNLDAGWQLLTQRTDYKQVVGYFKMTDVDPRELILLFKELYQTCPMIKSMVNNVPEHFLINHLQNQQIKNGSSFKIDDKHREAKEHIRSLLEILNAKYAGELRKDPHKEAEFLVSDYSTLSTTIKRDQPAKLRDLL